MPKFEERHCDSIYYFTRSEFKNYIQAIHPKSISVSDALVTFRELKCLPNKFKKMTVQQVADDSKLIQELFEGLKKMLPQSKYKLPYKKEEREKELIENLAENYCIDKEHTQAKVVTGHYKDEDTDKEFNYAVEVVLAPRKDIGVDHAGEVEFIGNVNSTPSLDDSGESYFQGGNYRWTDKKGREIFNTSPIGMLQECGFTTSDYVTASKKKVPSVVYLNVKTNCVDWMGSVGKTQINTKPYQDAIAKTISSLARKIPSYHGKGYCSQIYYHDSDSSKQQQDYVDDFLRERYDAIRADPSLKTEDRITQRGACYRIRPTMIEDGFKPRKDWGTTMETMAGSIQERCQVLFRLDREDLGIVAGERAVMYYDGRSYPVNVDSFKELAQNGVAIIIIEKEGIADLFHKFADKYGVALVHTKGRFTRDGKKLIEAVKEYGSFVGILVDYDAYGDDMAKATSTRTPIIGVNKETVTWLQQNGYSNLTIEEVEEEYSPGIHTNDPYLLHHRIELDSIAAKVGAEGLWKYIMRRIKILATPGGLDYNNVISIPANEVFYPKPVSDLLSYINTYTDWITEEERVEIQKDLTNVQELIDIEAKNTEIEERLSPIVNEDPGMQLIVQELKKLLKVLPKTLENAKKTTT
jgi:hypothetical protein